ncbi:hypothetical protein RDABS01_009646 [Bienertia sinuspersici]
METDGANVMVGNYRRVRALGDLRVLPDEVICDIISFLSPPDVARLACVSSVMYIFCNEEPLWMSLCLKTANGVLEYKQSWKKTVLQKKTNLTMEDFHEYDGKKPCWNSNIWFLPVWEKWAPGLLKDYAVPYLFQEDLFDVLNPDQRPPYRWLIIGPERSGASWHVDPVLTSAWNTLLCGRKRWALYPPGKVPLGVTVHVNEEDGDVNIETPSSLQWWLEFYPLLPDEDKPIECTQLPGETIYVPSGWWHCVLNLEPTVAVTQNFVNSTNFQHVCLDLAPGYRHKGVCRAGFLALADAKLEDMEVGDAPRKEKRIRSDYASHESSRTHIADYYDVWNHELAYDINFLSKFLDEDRDHYNSIWSASNCIGQREMREWLWRLWIGKPGMRDLIWKGACLAVNAGKWLECIFEVCRYRNLPSPVDDEKLPVGTGSNPVYLIAENVIKIYVEGGLETSLHSLGTELEFYNLLRQANSPMKDYVPDVLASGFIFLDSGCYNIVPWDGKEVPDVIADSNLMSETCRGYGNSFGLWSKTVFDYKKAGNPAYELSKSSGNQKIWPYIMTKRCKGKIFAELRDSLSWENALDVASFLGEQLHNLHKLPFPQLDNKLAYIRNEFGMASSRSPMEIDIVKSDEAAVWEIFLHGLAVKKKDVVDRLRKWGDPIPGNLIEKAVDYLPGDMEKLFSVLEGATCSWIHSDIMDDNIYLEPPSGIHFPDHVNASENGSMKNEAQLWRPSHILDFSDLSIGDPILDLIPIHLDIFKGDHHLLKQLLSRYKLPFLKKHSQNNLTDKIVKFQRASYRAMCYCILHEENVLGAIFSIWDDLRKADSWEEIEEKVWGILNECVDLS